MFTLIVILVGRTEMETRELFLAEKKTRNFPTFLLLCKTSFLRNTHLHRLDKIKETFPSKTWLTVLLHAQFEAKIDSRHSLMNCTGTKDINF